jgi:hypothetical protein
MAQDDNIVKLPDLLERQAKRITIAITKETKLREEWIDNKLELADALATAKEQFPSLIRFGEWCNSNGFGEDILNKNDRAALVAFGEDLSRARLVLEKTTRGSIQHIHANEFRFPHVRKTEEPPQLVTPQPKALPMPPPPLISPAATTPQPVPAKPQSQAAINRKYIEKLTREEAIRQGKPVPPLALDTETVNSIHKQVRDLATTVPNLAGKARRSFEKTLAGEMTKLLAELNLHKERTDIEAATKVEQEVKRRLALALPDYEKRAIAAREREEYYHKLVKAVKVPLTEVEFNIIREVLHPDKHPQAKPELKEKLNNAFVIFNLKKLNLTGKK